MNLIPPRYIALCGYPTSGKSEAQRALTELYDAEAVDDGYPMREFCVKHLGLTWEDVQTQAGKLKWVEFDGRRMQVREILGLLGNKFEELLGPNAMPIMALKRLERGGYANPGQVFSFGSVRREQGAYYQKHGGIVIGIRRPGVEPSPYEFDRFDENAVDLWIENDGLAQGLPAHLAFEDLKTKIAAGVAQHMTKAVLS